MSDTTVILLNNDGMGQAAPELRRRLISTYLQMLMDGGTSASSAAMQRASSWQ